jgi:hypothetical protein
LVAFHVGNPNEIIQSVGQTFASLARWEMKAIAVGGTHPAGRGAVHKGNEHVRALTAFHIGAPTEPIQRVGNRVAFV